MSNNKMDEIPLLEPEKFNGINSRDLIGQLATKCAGVDRIISNVSQPEQHALVRGQTLPVLTNLFGNIALAYDAKGNSEDAEAARSSAAFLQEVAQNFPEGTENAIGYNHFGDALMGFLETSDLADLEKNCVKIEGVRSTILSLLGYAASLHALKEDNQRSGAPSATAAVERIVADRDIDLRIDQCLDAIENILTQHKDNAKFLRDKCKACLNNQDCKYSDEKKDEYSDAAPLSWQLSLNSKMEA